MKKERETLITHILGCGFLTYDNGDAQHDWSMSPSILLCSIYFLL